MEWIEAGRAGPAPVGRAMQRPAARDAALIPCRVGATEKRNASRAGAAPVPVAPTGRNEIIASERSIGSIAAGAAACRAATGGLAPRRNPGPRRTYEPPADEPTTSGVVSTTTSHAQQKQKTEWNTPRTTWARFDETHCAMRVAMGHTVFRVLLPCHAMLCHGLESSL